MCAVPAGEFWMGCNESVDDECTAAERPGGNVRLTAYWIDRYEVTVDDYRACVDAGVCSAEGLETPAWAGRERPEWSWACNWGKAGREDHPLNCVDWHQAREYCRFVGKRLPSEAEWEKAARGEDGRKYPWGDAGFDSGRKWANIADETSRAEQPDWTCAAGYDDGYHGTAPVGSFPAGASPYGLHDMIGNTWEWTASMHRGRKDRMAIRGGGWGIGPAAARASARAGSSPRARNVNGGFRCALSATRR